jgi:hypothetical protein
MSIECSTRGAISPKVFGDFGKFGDIGPPPVYMYTIWKFTINFIFLKTISTEISISSTSQDNNQHLIHFKILLLNIYSKNKIDKLKNGLEEEQAKERALFSLKQLFNIFINF